PFQGLGPALPGAPGDVAAPPAGAAAPGAPVRRTGTGERSSEAAGPRGGRLAPDGPGSSGAAAPAAGEAAGTTGDGWTPPGFPSTFELTSQQVAVGTRGSVGLITVVAVLAFGHGVRPQRLAGAAATLARRLRRPGPR
ncbi:MAG: hypothetical protein AVDCRST_MAG35-3106, partial [uncultured Quadrisphaera sp.]